MVEDIITALSRIRWLFVIARNSSFTYKGRAVDVKQVGRELGVRYVLEGSVRKAANRVRITGQLIDATTGAHLWADRFEGALEDIFDLQDQMTRASWARSRRSWNGPRSSAPSASRPRASTPTTTICAAWQAAQVDREAIDEALPTVLPGDRARPEFRLGLWHGGVVLLLAQDQRLDDRSRRRRPPKVHGWRGGQWSWAGTMRSR